MTSKDPRRGKNDRLATLRDVAKLSGFSVMTVSRTIRELPGIAPETRKSVMAAAEQLSYRPNPVMSALALHRTRIKGRSGFSQIAFVTNFATRDGWKKWDWIQAYFDGARERGLELGYDLVNFWLRENGITQNRASAVLVNRGIKGLLFAPGEPGTVLSHYKLKWENFAAVTLGFSLPNEFLASVVIDHHAAGLSACHHLRRLGFRRMGFAMWRGTSIRQTHALADAFRGEQARYPRQMGAIPPLIWSHFEMCDFPGWFTSYQPDVLLTHAEGPLEQAIQKLPYREWRKTPVVYAALNELHPPDWPGVRHSLREAGALGIEQLNAQLLSGQLGSRPPRTTCMIDGIWQTPPDFAKPVK